ncbi:DUF3509 domain-containing protein [Pseudomonas sp. RIT-PI-AD]|uniref:DUF3509 domain-containing protein n=1 Tax=Pseudomonas sp. RIT-PI-AD TaxID=3035294 RepID=UPI0021DB77C5|nr:DUF3509 domain-containing protein [Pseudomonas sp. RIT-PI-AD]
MTVDIQEIQAAFPQHTVSASKRPDGSQLLTLMCEGEMIQRVIPSPNSGLQMRTEWIISAIRRDLHQEAGEVPMIDGLQSQVRTHLPTYVPTNAGAYGHRRIDRLQTRFPSLHQRASMQSRNLAQDAR